MGFFKKALRAINVALDPVNVFQARKGGINLKGALDPGSQAVGAAVRSVGSERSAAKFENTARAGGVIGLLDKAELPAEEQPLPESPASIEARERRKALRESVAAGGKGRASTILTKNRPRGGTTARATLLGE